MATRYYPCSRCRKRLKLTHGLTRYMNIYTSHQVFPIHMKLEQNTPTPGEEVNFRLHGDENLILKEQEIEGDHRNLGGKSLDTESRVRDGLARRTS